ncbi:MAG: SulP family inorganic anion transporter [Bacteroidota bacterium]
MILEKLKNDIPASIVVFLVALPLCLGVALASGAPLLSGIISGVLGGIVVGFLSGSQTSVSGPAAGLTAVVLAGITQLGSFDIFLTALLIAGAIQFVMGFIKAGIIGNYVPSNVIKGLLAAIGIILILKQIPHAVGYDIDPEDDFSFLQSDSENTFSELLKMFNFISPGAIIISTVSIFIIFFWDKIPLKKSKFFPSSLFVVIFGMGLNYIFTHFIPYLSIAQSHLVNVPSVNTNDLASYIHLPNLKYLNDYRVYSVALTIAVVASIETLLNIEAVDKIDPHKRESPPNRELIAQGVGNMLAGLFGGIPITSVIVRSSVNIQAGNSTKFSAILHGAFILISVLTLAPMLNLIPLASLASILLMTGYKLTKITLFKEMYHKGWHQFIPFVATIVAIVFTDLLIGVLIGLAVSVFYLMRSNYRNPFSIDKDKLHIGEVVRLELANQVSFFNKPSIKDTLWQVPGNSKVIIDATYSDFVDSDVLEIINDFKTTVAPERNIQLNVLGLKDKYELSDHIQFINVLNKETQQNLSPAKILNILKAGNERFINGKWSEKYFRHQVNATSMGQSPMAVIVCCIDSRTSPEIVFDAGIGDLLIIRIAGNIISPEILGSIELSVKKIGAKLIVIMAHSNCGAISLAIQQVNYGNIGFVTSKIDKAIYQCGHKHSEIDTNDTKLIEKITRVNAENSISEVLEQSSYLRDRVSKQEIDIIAAYYDTTSGKVHFK